MEENLERDYQLLLEEELVCQGYNELVNSILETRRCCYLYVLNIISILAIFLTLIYGSYFSINYITILVVVFAMIASRYLITNQLRSEYN